MSSIGHNSAAFGEDEKLPPKSQRIINKDRARRIEIAARQVSSLFRTPKRRIMEKRKGGEEGRALRRFLILYARGIGSPVWECAMIFDLNRKQIGQEEGAYLDMMARNPDLEEDADYLTSMCDYAAKVETGRFLLCSLSEIEAELAAKKAVKAAKDAADLIEAGDPAPVKKAPKPMTEAERIVAEGQAKRRAAERAQAVRILRAVIERGEAADATKEQRKDARRAKVALQELGES